MDTHRVQKKALGMCGSCSTCTDESKRCLWKESLTWSFSNFFNQFNLLLFDPSFAFSFNFVIKAKI